VGTKLQDDLGMSKGENDLFGSMVNVGAMMGALAGGFFLDFAGRKRYVESLLEERWNLLTMAV